MRLFSFNLVLSQIFFSVLKSIERNVMTGSITSQLINPKNDKTYI